MTTTPRALRTRSITLVAAAVLAFGLGGCSAISSITGQVERDDSGQVVEGNDSADVFALEVGDCINDSSTSEEITSLPVVPCSEPHDSEVFHAFDLTSVELPDAEALDVTVVETCYRLFETFIGVPFDDSLYYVSYISPSVDSWAAGDREVLCTVYDEAGQTTGSLAGIGR